MRSNERFTQLAGRITLFVAAAGVGSVINEVTPRDNQVNDIQLVECQSGGGLQRNTLRIDTLNNRAQPIHVGGQISFYGTHRGSLDILPDQKGGLSLEIPESQSIERIKEVNKETIVFHSRGVAYEITSVPTNSFSTSLQITASCEN